MQTTVSGAGKEPGVVSVTEKVHEDASGVDQEDEPK